MIDLPSRFWSPRAGPLKYIVLHTTEGTDSRTWLTKTGGVSAHYLVRESEVYRLVSEEHAAWHAGIVVGDPTTPLYTGVNPNDESIGIEIEGYAAQSLSEKSVSTTGGLIRDIWKRRGPLPLVAHYHLSPGNRSDPGVENYARIVNAATEEPLSEEYKQRLQKQLEEFAYTPIADLQRAQGVLIERIEQLEKEAGAPHKHILRINTTTETQ